MINIFFLLSRLSFSEGYGDSTVLSCTPHRGPRSNPSTIWPSLYQWKIEWYVLKKIRRNIVKNDLSYVLYCTLLYFLALHVLYCTVLYCTVLHCTVQYDVQHLMQYCNAYFYLIIVRFDSHSSFYKRQFQYIWCFIFVI